MFRKSTITTTKASCPTKTAHRASASPPITTVLLSFRETAEYLRISHTALRKRMREGTIPFLKFGVSPKSHVRFDAAELLDWMKAHRGAKS